jgi:hypothetical protein
VASRRAGPFYQNRKINKTFLLHLYINKLTITFLACERQRQLGKLWTASTSSSTKGETFASISLTLLLGWPVQQNTYGTARGKTPFNIYQSSWNILVRDFESKIIPMARHFGMALAPSDILSGGKFQTRKGLEDH